MTQPTVLELAKQGDPQAIATLMNRTLHTQGMNARVARQGERLLIMTEADTVPNRMVMTNFVRNGINGLQLSAIRYVRILGKQSSASDPAWVQELELPGVSVPESVTPEDEYDEEISAIRPLAPPPIETVNPRLVPPPPPSFIPTLPLDDDPDNDLSDAVIEEASEAATDLLFHTPSAYHPDEAPIGLGFDPDESGIYRDDTTVMPDLEGDFASIPEPALIPDEDISFDLRLPDDDEAIALGDLSTPLAPTMMEEDELSLDLDIADLGHGSGTLIDFEDEVLDDLSRIDDTTYRNVPSPPPSEGSVTASDDAFDEEAFDNDAFDDNAFDDRTFDHGATDNALDEDEIPRPLPPPPPLSRQAALQRIQPSGADPTGETSGATPDAPARSQATGNAALDRSEAEEMGDEVGEEDPEEGGFNWGGGSVFAAVILAVVAWVAGLVGYTFWQETRNADSVPAEVTPGPTESPASDPSAPVDTAGRSPEEIFEEAVALANQTDTLTAQARSQDDWKLVEAQWQQVVDLFSSIPPQAASYQDAQTSLANARQALTLAQAQAAQTPTGETLPSTTVRVSNATACRAVPLTQESPPVELTNVQFNAPDANSSTLIVGCITNHTDQVIGSVTVTYQTNSAQAPTTFQPGSGVLNFSNLAPGQTIPFQSSFALPGATQVTIDSISWSVAGASAPQALEASIQLAR